MTARPRGACPLCGQDVPLRRDGTPADHTIGTGRYAPGESRPYCDPQSAKEHRTALMLAAAREEYFEKLAVPLDVEPDGL